MKRENLTSITLEAKTNRCLYPLYKEDDSPRDKFRHAVLDALDAEAVRIGHVHGWRDNELPALFRAIDKILDRLGVGEPE